MKTICIPLAVTIAFIGGCQMTGNVNAPSKEWESSFLANPCCQTTYSLVGNERGAAVPMILATLDRFAGETNAQTRCLIIQGALWRPEVCTNRDFLAIIERGNNDPSESVRLKTSHMMESRLKMLETRQKEKKEAERSVRGDGKPVPQP